MENDNKKVWIALIVGAAIVFVAVATYLVFHNIHEDEEKERISNNTDIQEKQQSSL